MFLPFLSGLQVLLAASLTSQRCLPVTWCSWELREEPCLASAAPPCCPTRASSTTVMLCSHSPLSVNTHTAMHQTPWGGSCRTLYSVRVFHFFVFRISGGRRLGWWLQSVLWRAAWTVSMRVQMARWLSKWSTCTVTQHFCTDSLLKVAKSEIISLQRVLLRTAKTKCIKSYASVYLWRSTQRDGGWDNQWKEWAESSMRWTVAEGGVWHVTTLFL